MSAFNLSRPKDAHWHVRAVGSAALEIVMYDVIGASMFGDGVSAKSVVSQLSLATKAQAVRVAINSPGGSVADGMAIYAALKRHPGKVVVEIDGLAASIASVVAMAGDEIHMATGALMMVHAPHAPINGTAEEHRKAADALDKMTGGMVAAYVEKSGKNSAEIERLLAEETWFTAQEAVDTGLATHVGQANLAAAALAADFDLEGLGIRRSDAFRGAATHQPGPSRPPAKVIPMTTPHRNTTLGALARELVAARASNRSDSAALEGRLAGISKASALLTRIKALSLEDRTKEAAAASELSDVELEVVSGFDMSCQEFLASKDRGGAA